MKHLVLLLGILFTGGFLKLLAQADLPKGYRHGVVTLASGKTENGFLKENMRSDAAVAFIGEDGRKKNYNGNELQSFSIDSIHFVCIKGDFFKLVCEGEICFLQKSSNAAGHAVYNGTEAIFLNGTYGKINDYFFYDKAQQQLKLITKKNMNEMIAGTFSNCAAAIDKAKESGNDLAGLKQAVAIYNNRIK